ncbi:NADH:flavin oxidoreductase [Clostridium beijerinckii]|uniref:NADH-dependent flavin oxidoreductase n=1 Tax=Clostridium beijerinckii TaxID=1520 RepID=A0A1S9N0H0_CLOBE|nr:NADH:flavin oxidoreductase [Clostridium beijerinckii]MZK53120.1 NADH:flavin oxidoreductase [Clostridium beijerinckii]MZK61242.1 NADH:flavin oxidoreductase [Clostridium beijerinckii]MZK71441.1 NADH:flavin oxidoreductase [Clostridium beijerinckii]MZK76787.1 NADH:flavin oxidoreductase [Clostridium beijerinckii]MZK86508.1 NADH:flavin oxidoreductase [Clostridium beijerinckii]
MTKITDSIAVRGNFIKNRIVMAPMLPFSFHGDDGAFYGKQHIEHYTDRAKGGTGLIIMQGTRVSGAADSTNLWSGENIAVLKKIIDNCHGYGATIMLQLSCGDVNINELSIDEIFSMQADMKQAAISACEIGFDGVEYHFAHGFTLSKFIDASYNKRTDKYGGEAINRTRILTDLLPEIREKTHEKFIISVRMGEYLPESHDGIEVAKIFEKAGIDLLHISFGMNPPTHAIPEGFKCSPMTYSGCKIKKEVNIPVIAVNEIKTEEQVKFLIENDYVDFAAIGRGMFTDSEFANHVINGQAVRKCFGCGGSIEKCRWFTDHTLCPGRKAK